MAGRRSSKREGVRSSFSYSPGRRPLTPEGVLQDESSLARYTVPLGRRALAVQAVYPRARSARTRYIQLSRFPSLSTKPPVGRLPLRRGYADALKVLRANPLVRFCVQRKARREVLFAFSVAGRRGVGAGKRWRRSVNSTWSCR